jgi:photosystem II stability/assembly factor-like uncharacterized protein
MVVVLALLPVALIGSMWVANLHARAARPLVRSLLDAAAAGAADEAEAGDEALAAVWTTGAQAFAVGEAGAVYHSTDSGQSWFKQETGVDEDLRAVWGVGREVYAVGDSGRILHQSAEGVWIAAASGTDQDLHAVWGSSADDVWAAGDGGTVLNSRDRGVTWRRVESGTDEDLRALAGAPSGGVLAAGVSGTLRHLSSHAPVCKVPGRADCAG